MEKKKDQMRNRTQYLLVNSEYCCDVIINIIIINKNFVLFICCSILSYSSIEDGSLCSQCVCCSNQLYTLLLIMWNGCACESWHTRACVLWTCMSECGHAVVTGLHLCMWAQYSVVYGKPTLNEDSSTYIMPRNLKKGCKLNSYYW